MIFDATDHIVIAAVAPSSFKTLSPATIQAIVAESQPSKWNDKRASWLSLQTRDEEKEEEHDTGRSPTFPGATPKFPLGAFWSPVGAHKKNRFLGKRYIM